MIKSDNERDEMEQKAREFIDNPDRFYRQLLDLMPQSDPVRFVASVLGVAPSTVNRWARPRENDEPPSGTGSRSDLKRLLLLFQTVGAEYALGPCQQAVNAMQLVLDERRASLAATLMSEIKAPTIRETVAAEIGKNKRLVFEGVPPK